MAEGPRPIDPGVDIIGHYWPLPLRDSLPEPQPGQRVEMYTRPLDLQSLLAAGDAA